MLRSILLGTIAVSLLSGCFSAHGSRVVCPPIVVYTMAENAEALAELTDADIHHVHQPMINEMMDDYHKLRDAAVACRKPE